MHNSLKIRIFCTACALSAAFPTPAAASSNHASVSPVSPADQWALAARPAFTEQRTLLFSTGDMDSRYWRIPAVVATPKGTLVATADRRGDSNADLPNIIDVAVRRSVDGGRTWSEPSLLFAADEAGGYGDAALGVDPRSGAIVCLTCHGCGIWDSTVEDHARVVMSRSLDDGVTWSEPVDITETLFAHDGSAPIPALTGFVTSGAMRCDDRGRLYAAIVVWDGVKKYTGLSTWCIFSDDGGLTWQTSTQPVDTRGDESKVVPLSDGRLLMSIRRMNQGMRAVSYSSDRGLTWSEPRAVETLEDPGCNGAVIRHPDGYLLHTLANDPAKRRNVSLMRSDDNGLSWHKIHSVCPFPSAYSDIALLADGSVAVFTEELGTDGTFRLWLTRITLE